MCIFDVLRNMGINYNHLKEDNMNKKLYKSKTDKKLCGVCGGLAEYLAIDSTVIRLILVIAVLCAGCGVLAYIVAALVIPEQPE